MLNRLLIAGAAVVLAIPLHAATKPGRFALESPEGLELVHVVPKAVTYQGQKALRLDEEKNYAGEAVALLTGTEFGDGTIDVDLAGVPGAGSDAGARGFVGIAFRSTPMPPHSNASTCARQTAAPTISSGGTTRPSTRRCPIFRGSACARRRRACTSPTWTW